MTNPEQTSEAGEALRNALAAWDKYDPDISTDKVIRQANELANRVRAVLLEVELEWDVDYEPGGECDPAKQPEDSSNVG